MALVSEELSRRHRTAAFDAVGANDLILVGRYPLEAGFSAPVAGACPLFKFEWFLVQEGRVVLFRRIYSGCV